MIEFAIEGVPIPQHRPRACRRGNFINVYDSQKKDKENMRWKIKFEYRDKPLAMPLKIELLFAMPIPKSTSKIRRNAMLTNDMPPAKRPDADNLCKWFLDCLTGILYEDDSQIIELNIKKIYSEYPRTVIKAYPCKSLFEQEKDDESDI
ncbi:MAG: RusA family crossover junction endodeoxyribonuclease [Bacteroidetes bacterium]|nr:RusA family crossover junction endodeoxyribonuclease [Bacteroidota bacterium]